MIAFAEKPRKSIIYAKVSSYDQKNHGDLDRQRDKLVAYTSGGGFSNWKTGNEFQGLFVVYK